LVERAVPSRRAQLPCGGRSLLRNATAREIAAQNSQHRIAPSSAFSAATMHATHQAGKLSRLKLRAGARPCLAVSRGVGVPIEQHAMQR
jgi:hypothetical protein